MSKIVDHRDAIAARINAAFPTFSITTQRGRNVQARARRGSSGPVLLDLWWGGIVADRSAEMMAVTQGKAWRWLFHLTAATEEDAYEAFEDLHDLLCPSDGWRPDPESSPLELEDAAYLGQAEGGHVLWFSLVHDRFEG